MNTKSIESTQKDSPVELVAFKEEIDKIQTAIADFESGHKLNIAVIAEPFSGRTSIINELEKMNAQRVTRVNLSSLVKDKKDLDPGDPSKRIVIMDDCQFLYTRKIGGFDIIDHFLKSVVSSEGLFITTWNLFSWNYLDEVINIGSFFPVQIKLPRLTTNDIKKCTLSMYEENEIKFEEDVAFEKEKVFESMNHPVTIKQLEKTINIPYFKIDYSLLKVRLLKKEERVGIEDIIFDKIHHISNGNPGVAQIIWQKSLEYPVIKPSKIKENSFDIELDYYESFILNIILSMKTIKINDLAEIVGPDSQIEKTIFRLEKQDLIRMEDGSCTVRPEALKSIVDFLKKLRLVW